MRHAPLLLLAGLVACGTGKTETVLTNQGVACVDEAAGTVEVDFQGCLSSSCDTLLSAECTATWANGSLTVEATAVIESQGNVCTDDCGFITTACDLPDGVDLDNGVLSYAGLQTDLGDAACTEDL